MHPIMLDAAISLYPMSKGEHVISKKNMPTSLPQDRSGHDMMPHVNHNHIRSKKLSKSMSYSIDNPTITNMNIDHDRQYITHYFIYNDEVSEYIHVR